LIEIRHSFRSFAGKDITKFLINETFSNIFCFRPSFLTFFIHSQPIFFHLLIKNNKNTFFKSLILEDYVKNDVLFVKRTVKNEENG